MSWISERWRAFSEAAGPRRYIIGAVSAVIIAISDHIRAWLTGAGVQAIIGIPSWLVAVVAALGMIAFWLLEYLVQLRRRIKGGRYELAKLRADGVAIRNSGRSILTRDALVKWEKKTIEWNVRVIESIRKINEADAEWFSILDVVPSARIPVDFTIVNDLQASADHYKLYREHDLRLKRLGKMIYRLWER